MPSDMAQTVLITGGSRGIGAACVRTFAENGWNIAFTYSKSREAADRLAGETGALALLADQQDTAAVELAAAEVKAAIRHHRCRGLQCRHRRTKAVPEYHRRGLDAHAGCQSHGYGGARFAPCCLKCCTTTREASLRCRPCGENAARPARAIIPRARLRLSA